MDTQTITETSRGTGLLHGLCPKCCAWFECTGWTSLSAPVCPTCGTAAHRVARGGPHAARGDRAPGRSAAHIPHLSDLWMG